MPKKDKSKKQAAQDYFASLVGTRPLRERVDELVEYMKIEYVNGQTERVVFNYIRDLISQADMPSPNAELMKGILKNKFFVETRYERSVYNGEIKWDSMNANEKFSKLLSLTDLYETDRCFQLSKGHYASNKGHVSREKNTIKFGDAHKKISDNIDNYWFSNYSKGYDLTRNHFPFFTRDQLENPASIDDVVDISREFLSEKEASKFHEMLHRHGSAKNAYLFLKKNEGTSSSAVSGGGLKYSDGKSGMGGAIFAILVLAVLGYIFLIPDDEPDSSTTGSTYSADSNYEDSSSAVVDGMNLENREKYNNLNSEGKAYVDEQMKKADEFCARNPDFDSCW